MLSVSGKMRGDFMSMATSGTTFLTGYAMINCDVLGIAVPLCHLLTISVSKPAI